MALTNSSQDLKYLSLIYVYPTNGVNAEILLPIKAKTRISDVVRAYGKRLLGFVRKKVNSNEEAEDILTAIHERLGEQQFPVRLHRKGPRLQGPQADHALVERGVRQVDTARQLAVCRQIEETDAPVPRRRIPHQDHAAIRQELRGHRKKSLPVRLTVEGKRRIADAVGRESRDRRHEVVIRCDEDAAIRQMEARLDTSMLLIAAAFLGLALALSLLLRRLLSDRDQALRTSPAPQSLERTEGGILAGAVQVWRSPYLTAIAAWVFLANLIVTYFYLEQARQ